MPENNEKNEKNLKKFASLFYNGEINLQYEDAQEKTLRKMEINFLFDRNFGKDWRYLLFIYYNKELKRHFVTYRCLDWMEQNKIIKSKTHAEYLRKCHFSCSQHILKIYFNEGFEEAIKAIDANKFRVKCKNSKGEWANYSPSNEIFDRFRDYMDHITELPKGAPRINSD